jgi:NAD(P)H-dependent FMN reductase
MKFVVLAGTNNIKGTNRTFAQYITNKYADTADLICLDLVGFPGFIRPDERKLPEAIQIVSDDIAASDGVIIVTPEYNHSIPSSLKSFIEWISYTTRALYDKPVMIVGGSLGNLGSSRGQQHLRLILDAPEVKGRVLPSSEFFLSQSGEAFNEEGNLISADKAQELDNLFSEFVIYADILNRTMAAQESSEPRVEIYDYQVNA